jgi:hypothetical protein
VRPALRLRCRPAFATVRVSGGGPLPSGGSGSAPTNARTLASRPRRRRWRRHRLLFVALGEQHSSERRRGEFAAAAPDCGSPDAFAPSVGRVVSCGAGSVPVPGRAGKRLWEQAGTLARHVGTGRVSLLRIQRVPFWQAARIQIGRSRAQGAGHAARCAQRRLNKDAAITGHVTPYWRMRCTRSPRESTAFEIWACVPWRAGAAPQGHRRT